MSNVIESGFEQTVQFSLTADLREIMSPETRQVLSEMNRLPKVESSSTANVLQESSFVGSAGQDVEVFEALSQAKIYVSSVAMHLDKVWRERLFHKLDNLHDTEEWEASDKPVVFSSFETFIRTILTVRPKNSPALGLTGRGHVVAAWIAGQDRLTMEFLPNKMIRSTLAYTVGARTERAAIETCNDRLLSVMSPFNPSRWFQDEIRSASS